MCFTLPSLSIMMRTGTGLNLRSANSGSTLYANRNITAAPPRNGAGLLRQAHLVHFLDEILGQFYIPTNKHKLDHVTADLRRQYAPMQLGDGRTVVKADEGVIGDPDKRRWLFHPIVRAQTFVVEIDQVQRVPSRGKREKQILSNNQDTALAFPLEFVRGPDLRENVVAGVRRRWTGVFFRPIRG